jgi:hypothetical protein
MLRRLALAVLCALASTPSAVASDAGQGGRLKIPPPAPAENPATQEPTSAEPAGPTPALAAPSLWSPPANAAEQAFLEFETRLDPSDAHRAACLDRLRALGLETRATALKALGSDYGHTVLLAAELLEWVGATASEDPRDVAALLDAASRTSLVEAAGRCLDAARRLNNGTLPARAVTLLAHPNRNVRVVAEGRLQRSPDSSHVERLLQSAEFGRDADVRLRSARLIAAHTTAPETRLVLRRLVRDESVEVAFSAAAALAGEARPEQVAFLVSELRQKVGGAEAGYLAYALLLQQSRHDAALIPDDALPRLEFLLEESDIFASGAAAACLAEYAYRSGETAPAAWRPKVGFALVRAVAGVIFYPQFARFSPLAADALERASGEEFADRGEWIAWFERVGPGGLGFLRAQIEIGPESSAGLRVSWSRRVAAAPEADAPPQWCTLAGPEGWLLPSERLLGPRVLGELVGALRQTGVLDAVGGGNRFGPASDPIALTLEISTGAQRKRIVFRGRSGGGEIGQLADRLDAWHVEQAWQLLAGSEGREFLAVHLVAMEGFDAEARAAAMVELTRGRVRGLDGKLLSEWCGRLLSAPGIVAAWDAAVATEMLAEIPARAADADLALRMAETALLRADPALVALLGEAALGVEEPLRTRILTLGLPRLGLDAARILAADGRLSLRVATLLALPAFGPESAADLRLALTAEELPAVLAAVRGLGELADAESADLIAALAVPGVAHEVRKEALWALGRIGDPRMLPVLESSALSDQPALRVTALFAIAHTPGEAAQASLSKLFTEYAGTALEGSYLRALLDRGAASARRTLQPYLVSKDAVHARRAALLGGQLGDPATAPSLMEWLPGDPRNAELLEALATTLCVDFRSLPDPAGTYLAWWRDQAEQPATSWFLAAARGSGFELPEGFSQASPAQTRESVAVLLTILETGPAHLRASATYFLHGLTGVDAKVVLAETPQQEVQRRSQPWRDWLDG